MTPKDKPDFLAVMNGIAAIKRVELTREALDLWWATMRHWDLSDFRDAAVVLLRSCEFMPTPRDFETLRKAGRATTAEAWASAVQHCRYGAYRLAPLSDAVTDRAVAAIGGYRVIAMCDEEKLHFLERRFAEAYETIQDADDIRRALPHIARRTEIAGPSGAQIRIEHKQVEP